MNESSTMKTIPECAGAAGRRIGRRSAHRSAPPGCGPDRGARALELRSAME